MTHRFDAKAFGPKASECQVDDRGDGTYTILFTASVAGDYRLQARLENVEMSPLHLHVVERPPEEVEAAPAAPPPEEPAVVELEEMAVAEARLSRGSRTSKEAPSEAAPSAAAGGE